MTGLNYVTRRGAIYVWRRRLPACVSTTSYLQISLRTPTFSTAKILANPVNAGFATCICHMKSQRITQAEAQRFLSDLVVQQLEKIEEERYYEPDAPSPKDWRQRYLNERGRAVAARLVAARGVSAALFPEDISGLEKAEVFGENFWLVLLYRALAANQDFCDGGFEAVRGHGAAAL